MYKSHLYKALNVQIKETNVFGYFKHANYLGMHAIAACPVEPTKSVGLRLFSWHTKHNPTDYAATNRLSLFALLSAPLES